MPAERIESPLPLSRCPFCGGESKLFFIKEEHPFVHRVACVGECKTAFGKSYSYSEALFACKQWNHRANTKEENSDNTQQLKAEIRSVVERLVNCAPISLSEEIGVAINKLRKLSAV